MLKMLARESLNERLRFRAERKTVLAVRHCQNLIASEIENRFRVRPSADIQEYFQSIERALQDFHPDSLIEEIYAEQFGLKLNSPGLKLETPAVTEMQAMVQAWSRAKRATVSLTKVIEATGREVCQQAVDRAFGSLVLTAAFDAGSITQVVLAGLGIKAEAEAEELERGIGQRLNGALSAVKSCLIRQINRQVAELFYAAHDAVIEKRIREKIRRLSMRKTKTTGVIPQGARCVV